MIEADCEPAPRDAPLFTAPVLAVLATMFGTTLITSSVENALLLYQQRTELTARTDATFYVRTQAVFLLVPVTCAIPLGHLAHRFGTRAIFPSCYAVVAVGLTVLLLFRRSRLLFLFGYVLYAVNVGVRVVRFAVVSEYVPTCHRTMIMALYQLMIPVGAIVAPVIWMAFQMWQGEIVLWHSFLVVDRFSLTFAFCVLVALCLVLLTFVALSPKRPNISERNSDGMHARPHEEAAVEGFETSEILSDHSRNSDEHVEYVDGEEEITPFCGTPDGQFDEWKAPPTMIMGPEGLIEDEEATQPHMNEHYWRRFKFFALLIMLMNLTYALVLAVFQPALVQTFHATDRHLANVYVLMGTLSLLPPILTAAMSKRMSDRQIILLGIVLKIIGALQFVPVFGAVREWQVIVGMILVVKATTFFTAAAMSAFTKVLGPLCTPASIGQLCAMANSVPAFVQLAFAANIVQVFESGWSAVFVLPAVLALFLVLSPSGWELLDPDSGTLQEGLQPSAGEGEAAS